MKNEIILYQANELPSSFEVKIEDETVWLNQDQMATLFGRNRVAITQHIGNIFKEGELDEEVVCKDFLLTTQHGAIKGKSQTRKIKIYLGKKWFAFSKMEMEAKIILQHLYNNPKK